MFFPADLGLPLTLPTMPLPSGIASRHDRVGDAGGIVEAGECERGTGAPALRVRGRFRPFWSVGSWLTQPIEPGANAGQRLVPSWLAKRILGSYIADLPSPGDTPEDGASDLEVLIPVGPRDLEVAPLALASVRRYLMNRMTHIAVATPHAHLSAVRNLLPGVEIIADEDILSDELRRSIVLAAPSGREGWLTQQFVEMVYVASAAKRSCLVWDADTIMVRPQTLMAGNVAALPISLEHHPPYFELIRRLLPTLPLPEWSSTVAHHMIMDPELLAGLFREIETRADGRPWWSAILSLVDRLEQSCMAEYELYGQWVRHRHADRVRLVGFRNVILTRESFSPGRAEMLARSRRIDSISLHWWLNR